jgi:ATP-binding cassette subfamily F protein 3
LLKALQAYQGTILFVSHDQDFVNKLATDIIELSVDGAKEYPGNYESYLYQKDQEVKKLQQLESAAPKKNNDKIVAEPKKVASPSDLKNLERKIQKLEHEISRIEQSFANFVYGTPQFNDAQKKLTDLKKELAVAVAEWESQLS